SATLPLRLLPRFSHDEPLVMSRPSIARRIGGQALLILTQRGSRRDPLCGRHVRGLFLPRPDTAVAVGGQQEARHPTAARTPGRGRRGAILLELISARWVHCQKFLAVGGHDTQPTARAARGFRRGTRQSKARAGRTWAKTKQIPLGYFAITFVQKIT